MFVSQNLKKLISWYKQQRYLISSGLTDAAPNSAPSKKSRSGISWMG
jgi:hypothetical protein